VKVVVGLSGGVDSTLAAALLREQGHEVVGVTLRLHAAEPPSRPPLDVPWEVVDLRAPFEEQVVRPFVEAYRAGRTPNPCAVCNARVKFGLLLDRARELGADCLATGHYARVGRAPDGAPRLERPVDRAKDQTYFLFGIGRVALPRLLFPLGDLAKADVRRAARARGLAAAEAPESQEICFVPGNDYAAFLAGRLPAGAWAPGPIRDVAGALLGTHRGLLRYTVGQRRGIGVAAARPLYVVALEPESNTLVVGADGELWREDLAVEGVNWLVDEPREGLRAEVRIRSRHAAAPALLTPAGPSRWRVRFDEPQRAVAPGQAAVFYDGEVLLGGGWIE
jgi:tRNA-specific 2-thiouridylase